MCKHPVKPRGKMHFITAKCLNSIKGDCIYYIRAKNCPISMFFRTQEGIIDDRVTPPETAMAISIKIAAAPHPLQKHAIFAYF